MRKIWLKIITNKVNPLYWPGLLFLWLLSLFYRIALWFNNLFLKNEIKVESPVISVGNLTVGGSGKTPVTIELARYFISKNKKVGVVASGYGRKNKINVIAVGQDIIDSNVDNTGDEVMMMAEKLPEVYFAIGRSKSDAALVLDKKQNPDVIIIDDGYQHRRLHRNINLLIIDAGIDLRKEALFPLGRRREPLRAMKRAEGIILTKTNMLSGNQNFRDWINDKFKSKFIAEVEFINDYVVFKDTHISIEDIADRKVYFFAGVGSFDALLNHLKKQFVYVTGFRQFPDHCRYDRAEIIKIKKDIDRLQPDCIITTQKDFVKIKNIDFGRKVYFLNLKLYFKSGEKLLFEKLMAIIES
jgi:tetraacyldisaccharide 4'-kinase